MMMMQSQAATSRPLALRLRPDLIATSIATPGRETWVVKDPLTLEHFQFTSEEFALLDWLRRPTSLAELQRRFMRRFPPQTIATEAIWDFLRRVHAAGLLLGEGPDQGSELLARRRRERFRRWALSWASLLAIRFRGVDPDRMLGILHSKIRWLLNRVSLLAIAALIALAVWLLVSHYREFVARLPELGAVFEPRNLPWLLLAIGSTKVLHELGHGLACKHFGGQVRELGLMLLAFAPCLYCDVSDAWRLRNKWQRIAISAAGIGVELLLAAIATIVWWYAQPGFVQLLAMNVMIVGTVNTLLINGNPLLRYDGYYVLSDLVEVPNLWQRSREALRRVLSEWLLGEPGPDDPLVAPRSRLWLCVYAVASKVYLVVVFVGILWGLVLLLYPLHLEVVAYVLGLTVLGGSLVGPVASLMRWGRDPSRRQRLDKVRLATISSVLVALGAGGLAMPVTYHVAAPLVLMPHDAARVFATVEGTLVEAAAAGSHVERGEQVARLVNPEIALDLEKLAGQYELRRLRVEHLEKLRGVDREANDELPTARAALEHTRQQLEERREEAQRLELLAPQAGVIIAAPYTEPARDTPLRLASWSGSLLDASNRGALVEPGELVCLVGDPTSLTATLLVDDADVKRLAVGQKARLLLDQFPGRIFHGTVADIARHEIREADGRTSADLATLYRSILPAAHDGPVFQVRVLFEDAPGSLRIGGRGQAKVGVERITVARRLARWFASTFRLPM